MEDRTRVKGKDSGGDWEEFCSESSPIPILAVLYCIAFIIRCMRKTKINRTLCVRLCNSREKRRASLSSASPIQNMYVQVS